MATTTIIPIIESVIKTALSVQMPVLISLLGVDVEVERKSIDVFDEVYGVYGGVADPDTSVKFETRILFPAIRFNVSDSAETGFLDDVGFGYTYGDIQVGDVFYIKRQDDDRTIGTKVTFIERIGITTEIISRVGLSSLGD